MCRREAPWLFGPGPDGIPTLVANTTSSRLADRSRTSPTIRSLLPPVYTSAVSMKLMPASKAVSSIFSDASSSAGPPKFIAPKHNDDTCTPVRPSGRISIMRVDDSYWPYRSPARVRSGVNQRGIPRYVTPEWRARDCRSGVTDGAARTAPTGRSASTGRSPHPSPFLEISIDSRPAHDHDESHDRHKEHNG